MWASILKGSTPIVFAALGSTSLQHVIRMYAYIYIHLLLQVRGSQPDATAWLLPPRRSELSVTCGASDKVSLGEVVLLGVLVIQHPAILQIP